MPRTRGNRRTPATALLARWWLTVPTTSVLIVALLSAPGGAPRDPQEPGSPTAAESGHRMALVAVTSGEQSGERRPARRTLWAPESGTDTVAGVVDVVSDFGDGSGLAGTAIVIGDGTLVTAAHLVPDPRRGRVWVSDPGGFWTYPAWVVGMDEGLDLAVLRVPDAALTTAALGDSRTVREGDELHVVGNARGWGPLRDATGTVLDTEAVIASTAPAIGSGSSGATSGSMSGMIEIQASVAAGDSGGAVLNSRGQVVAIILAYVPTTGSDAVGNRGYGMPLNRVMRAVNRLTTLRTGHRSGR
jgi:S1-C subfamily serine protease